MNRCCKIFKIESKWLYMVSKLKQKDFHIFFHSCLIPCPFIERKSIAHRHETKTIIILLQSAASLFPTQKPNTFFHNPKTKHSRILSLKMMPANWTSISIFHFQQTCHAWSNEVKFWKKAKKKPTERKGKCIWPEMVSKCHPYTYAYAYTEEEKWIIDIV